MHPHCSAFAESSWRRGPFPKSLFAITDRLTRCGADSKLYPVVIEGGLPGYADPPR